MKKVLFVNIIVIIALLFFITIKDNNECNCADMSYIEDPITNVKSFDVEYTKYQVYTNVNKPSLVGTYDGINEFEFVEYFGPVTLSLSPYYIETCFGRLYVHNEKLFYTIIDGVYQYYKIVGEKDFSLFYR